MVIRCGFSTSATAFDIQDEGKVTLQTPLMWTWSLEWQIAIQYKNGWDLLLLRIHVSVWWFVKQLGSRVDSKCVLSLFTVNMVMARSTCLAVGVNSDHTLLGHNVGLFKNEAISQPHCNKNFSPKVDLSENKLCAFMIAFLCIGGAIFSY